MDDVDGAVERVVVDVVDVGLAVVDVTVRKMKRKQWYSIINIDVNIVH